MSEIVEEINHENEIKEREANYFPARYTIGERVLVDFGNGFKSDNCYIRTITFTSGKIRYSIKVKTNDGDTTLHNIDSYFLNDYYPHEVINLDFDNYS